MKKALFPLLFILLAAACKKSDNKPASNTCMIASIDDSSKDLDINAKTVLSYDVDGNLLRVATTGTANSTRLFQHIGDMITVSVSESGLVQEVDTVIVNSAGYIASRQSFNAGPPPYYTTSSYYYGADNEVANQVNYDSHGNVDSVHYAWNNGDLLSTIELSSLTVYTYDSTTTIREGDWLRTQQMLRYGAVYAPTKHMVRSVAYGHDAPMYFYYTLDNSGKVTSYITYIGNSVQYTTYHYTCD